jgi:hypothetical protein
MSKHTPGPWSSAGMSLPDRLREHARLHSTLAHPGSEQQRAWAADLAAAADALESRATLDCAIAAARGPAEVNAETRMQQIQTRHMEINATLAQWKMEFFVEGIERPFGDRLKLEAERAALALESRRIGAAANQAKLERRQRLNNSVLAHLRLALRERGLYGLIDEAERRAAGAG